VKTVREVLLEARDDLSESPDADTAWLDAMLLLCFALNTSKEKLLASFPDKVENETLAKYRKLIKLKKDGQPLAYITGRKEFYGRDFIVNNNVLTPRPDTEILVEKALETLNDSKKITVLDLCSGSGCIGLTLKAEKPSWNVSLADISEPALKISRKNAEILINDTITFISSNLWSNITGTYDLIVTNPPYLDKPDMEDKKACHWPEPLLALDGGDDGLDLVRIIIEQAPAYMNENAWLFMEAGPDQIPLIAELLNKKGWKDVNITPDLAGRPRVAGGRR